MKSVTTAVAALTIAAALLFANSTAASASSDVVTDPRGDASVGDITKFSGKKVTGKTITFRVDMVSNKKSTETTITIGTDFDSTPFVLGKKGAYTSFYQSKTLRDGYLLKPSTGDKNLKKKCLVSAKATYGKHAHVTFVVKAKCLNGLIEANAFNYTKGGGIDSATIYLM